MRNHEVKNRAQQSEPGKNDRKNKQETAAAYPMQQQPQAQQSESFQPKGNRHIRSWVEGTPGKGN